jgi:porin
MNAFIRSPYAWLATAAMAVGQPAFAEDAEAAPTKWLTPGLTYDGSALGNLRGGERTGSTYGGNLHLKATVRGETLGWPGTSAFVDVLNLHGGQPSRLVGDAQGTSNIRCATASAPSRRSSPTTTSWPPASGAIPVATLI